MTEEQKKEIIDISKSFTKGLGVGKINGSGWLIVDPLSAYLNAYGIKNTLQEMPKTEQHDQVLIITFEDGTKFIPAGGDLKVLSKGFKNWMFLPK